MAFDTREQRIEALGALMAPWIQARQAEALAFAALGEAKAEHKKAEQATNRIQQAMEHVGGCRMIACLRCAEIAANGG